MFGEGFLTSELYFDDPELEEKIYYPKFDIESPTFQVKLNFTYKDKPYYCFITVELLQVNDRIEFWEDTTVLFGYPYFRYDANGVKRKWWKSWDSEDLAEGLTYDEECYTILKRLWAEFQKQYIALLEKTHKEVQEQIKRNPEILTLEF